MLTQEDDVEIHALAARGWSVSAIARHTGRDRKTVRKYLSSERPRREPPPSCLEPYLEYTTARFADDGVPKTLKEDRCRRSMHQMRCCTRDGGWPSAVALQGEIANHREVRRSRAGVLSVAEKARRERVRCGSRRRAEANHR